MKPIQFCCCVLLLTHCGKSKSRDPQPEDQLPAATQTGANTFGCLVNGQPWTPKGNNGTTNFSVSYDPTYRHGTLNVGAYRYIGKCQDEYQITGFYSDSIPTIGRYTLTLPHRQEGVFIDETTTCQYRGSDPYYRRGSLTITRLDLAAGIISGTFEFTLHKLGCDSIRVTNGRFDRRL